ncbi:carbohydrate kinase family protein [Candidatus Bathyarchaeota archaeon]|nr:carbohydrate kinase family protein [Candidatus Bathyarchaeota archaeon]
MDRLLVLNTGILVVDIIAAELPRIAEPGELLFVPEGIAVSLGGHSGNVSIDLLQLGLRSEDVYLVSVVGKDVFGDYAESFLKSRGVRAELKRVEASTSKNLILVVENEDRRFHVDVGSNLFLDTELVSDAVEKFKPHVFYVGGAGMLGGFDDRLPEILKKAKKAGSLTVLDVVAPYGKGWDFVKKALPYCDLFHCNLLEASHITDKEGIVDALKALRASGCKLPVITMGDQGLTALFKDVFIEMPAFKIRVVDPTGAGDAFCAGLILKLSLKLKPIDRYTLDEVVEALIFGSACGALCCTAKGTTTNVQKDKVKLLLNDQDKQFRKSIKLMYT